MHARRLACLALVLALGCDGSAPSDAGTDGRLVISSDRVLLRTAQHTTMRFDQLAMLPYIGDGSPIEQTMLIDEIVVAEGVRP